MNTINSTALPNVTFINAPTVSPRRLATLSVAWLRRAASGTIATAFMANITPAGSCAKSRSTFSVVCLKWITQTDPGQLTHCDPSRNKDKQNVDDAGEEDVLDDEQEPHDKVTGNCASNARGGCRSRVVRLLFLMSTTIRRPGRPRNRSAERCRSRQLADAGMSFGGVHRGPLILRGVLRLSECCVAERKYFVNSLRSNSSSSSRKPSMGRRCVSFRGGKERFESSVAKDQAGFLVIKHLSHGVKMEALGKRQDQTHHVGMLRWCC